MDFTTRGDSPNQAATPASNRATVSSGSSKKQKRGPSGKLFRYAAMVLLVSITILVVAVTASFAFSNNEGAGKYVDDDRMQAVFLNGGQVYFGKVGAINNEYMTMTNVYYLRVNQQVQPNQNSQQAANDVSLVKLGCELHGPQDQMIINSEQVVFWENLKSDGQVAKAVDQYVKENPNGQDCSKTTESSAAPAPAAATPAPATNTNR